MRVVSIKHGKKQLPPLAAAFLQRCERDERLQLIQLESQYPKHAIELAKNFCAQADVFIVIGGDGTLNEVVNGMLSVSEKTPSILLFRAGTGNDFSRYFKPISMEQSPNDVLSMPPTEVPLGQVQTEKELRYFINVADVGFGGNVVQTLEHARKILGPKISYFYAILWTFIRFRKKGMVLNEGLENTRFFMIAVCLGSTFGDGMVIAPGKSRWDSYFQIVQLRRIRVWHYLFYLGKLRKGKRIFHPEIKYHDASSLHIGGLGSELDAEIDGEPLRAKTFHFTLAETKLRFLNQRKN
jgi:diacylglycerol kinase family enzyme